MLASLLFAAFIAFLYLPSQIFRFWASIYVDLNRRRTASQLDEFLMASIPSILLNVVALIVWSSGRRLGMLFGRDWMPAPVWKSAFAVVMSLVSADKDPIANHKDVLEHAVPQLGFYWLVLIAATTVFGLWYGRAERSLARGGGSDRAKSSYPTWVDLFRGFILPKRTIDRVRIDMRRVRIMWVAARKLWLAVVLFFHHVWDRCYVQNKNTIYPWAVQNSSVFVMLKGGLQVFHGTLRDYRNTRDGEVEGILLENVQRFAPDTLEQDARAGRDPFVPLTGPLYLKWDEIRDINFAPEDLMPQLL